jgi:thiol-disulfide isomerase/thioredoxin
MSNPNENNPSTPLVKPGPLPVITKIESVVAFQQLLIDNPGVVVLKFGAEWCGPCKKIPISQLMSEFPANWLKCDVDRNKYSPGYCNIRTIPSFMVKNKNKCLI